MFFHEGNCKVNVAFENKGLMQRDQQQNELLKIFQDAASKKWSTKVTYQVGVTKPKSKEKTVIIIDESDAIMFKDLLAFNKAIKGENIYVIGLTATAYGKESSLEADAIDRLDFRVYRTCDQDLTIDPTVHRSQKIETPFNYEKLIGEQRTLRPVLVLAKGDMFDYLATLAHVTVVTENTPYEELRHLDEKKGIA